jgi:ribonuclease HII
MKVSIGIDEVGRGPLAGPVAVGAFWIADRKILTAARALGVPLCDSKKLTREQREIWYRAITVWQKEGKCVFSVVMISAKTIDMIGIAPAIRRALTRALYTVADSARSISTQADFTILLDGGLKAPVEFKKQKTIIKGDEKEKVISLASIVAKVTRDRHMLAKSKKFPEYGFEKHVGYGTRAHYAALKKHGTCILHRQSFLKKFHASKQSK